MNTLPKVSKRVQTLGDEIHVWKLNLDDLAKSRSDLVEILSNDERTRAGRFYFEKDTQRFIAARAGLRMLLADYLERSANELKFSYNQYGKPYLKSTDEQSRVNFNISHSVHLALLAFGKYSEIGVDIEQHRPEFASRKIAQRFFSKAEAASLRELQRNEFIRTFYDCWTRKEAYIKAKGLGLSLELGSFSVETRPVSRPVLKRSQRFESDPNLFSFFSFIPEEHFSAALAVNSDNVRTRFFEYDLDGDLTSTRNLGHSN